jgi:hypothetical protein
MKKWGTLFSLFVLMAVFAAGVAEGAGTLRLTFKYKNSAGVEQPLSYAYVYLRNAANEPPMEKFFSPADQISAPSSATGLVTMTVPEGNYYIRVTRRNSGGSGPLGPPENGDYTWNQAKIITISANTTTDLGTKYAWLFGSAPVTISGTVKNYLGAPLAGRIIKATIVPCIDADYSSQDPSEWVYSNRCGPEKHLALQRTDANGNYTLFLRDPGTFYIYESTCLGDQHQQYVGNSCIGSGTGPVTVNVGENKVVNFTGRY